MEFWSDQGQRGEHRQHREVLEQENAERGAAMRTLQLSTLGEKL